MAPEVQQLLALTSQRLTVGGTTRSNLETRPEPATCGKEKTVSNDKHYCITAALAQTVRCLRVSSQPKRIKAFSAECGSQTQRVG